MSALHRWSALAVLCLPVLLISIDMTVLGIAVPALSASLRPSSAQLLWIVDLYSFLVAGLLVLMGSLGDRIGRRRLLLIGALAFGVASILAAFAPTAAALIAARALLGLGGATLMPSTLGLLRTIFTDRGERRTAVAIWAAGFSAGAVLGPILGGLLLEHYWWGSVFLINVPVMVVFVIAGRALLPEARDPAPGPFDLISALLSIAGLLAVVYALKEGAHHLSSSVLVIAVVGVILLWLFVRRQQRLAQPMLDLRLFLEPGFSPAILTNVASVFALMGATFFLPQYLQLVLGMSPARAGLWLMPLAVATVVASLASPSVARWVPVRVVVASGMGLTSLGLALGTQLHVDSSIVIFAVVSVLVGLGAGFAETLTNDVILTAAPPARASAAAAISETGYELGAALGTAVLGTLGLSVYAHRLGPVPGVSSADLDLARATLGATHEVAARLSDESRAAFLRSSAAAFTDGLDVVLVTGAVVTLAASLMAARLLVTRDEHTDPK